MNVTHPGHCAPVIVKTIACTNLVPDERWRLTGKLEIPHKVGFGSLGCPKAQVDSGRIITRLKMDGYDIVFSYEKVAATSFPENNIETPGNERSQVGSQRRPKAGGNPIPFTALQYSVTGDIGWEPVTFVCIHW